MIEVNIEGFEQLGNLVDFDKAKFGNAAIRAIEYELSWLIDVIRNDPNIPDTYKNSLMMVLVSKAAGVDRGVTLIAYAPSKNNYKRFGNRLKWGNYICPIRKYFGGELAPEYNGPEYIRQLWILNKDKIVNNIKSRLMNVLLGSVGE